MRLFRALSTAFLVLALVAGSVLHAHTSGLPRAVGVAELCVGLDARTVAIDGRGQPVEHSAVHCPDCLPALAALTGVDGGAQAERPLRFAPVAWRLTADPALPAPARNAQHARGPPFMG